MSYKQRLKDIKAFVFDVDGVFTDGSIYLLPGENMCRKMSVLDGYAVVKALENNYKIGIITGGNDPGVQHRMKYLGIEYYYAKSADKSIDFEDFKAKTGLSNHEILMMGDDLPDLPLLKVCGISACPPNAVSEVKANVDYISPAHGGSGAVRNVIEQVLKIQGKWATHSKIKST